MLFPRKYHLCKHAAVVGLAVVGGQAGGDGLEVRGEEDIVDADDPGRERNPGDGTSPATAVNGTGEGVAKAEPGFSPCIL